MNPLSKAILLLEELRKHDQEFPAQQAVALLAIAREEGMTQQKVAALVGASKSAAQRIFDKLSDRGVNGKPGLALIEVRPGMDARERLAYLTPKGRRVVKSLTQFTGG